MTSTYYIGREREIFRWSTDNVCVDDKEVLGIWRWNERKNMGNVWKVRRKKPKSLIDAILEKYQKK